MRESSPAAFEDSRARTEAARTEAEEHIRASRDDGFAGLIRERFRPDTSLTLSGSLTSDSTFLHTMVDYTYGAGVRLRLRAVTVGRDLIVWETDFINPPDQPEHCPPALVWLHTLREGRTQRLRLAYQQDPAA
ncbi:hypothetical protein GCM10010172_02700 [Paractinoplanes ferrugineus]|uniref:Uncharacterized protein n=1 Tax=Paractinoplanes ferrugineus TaxID=113564 RepID=A0A919J363_9ACTN|nr:hypothetical protein [Actinoplanes ferrugineus]GIE13675.1 hypothetical protein Afe05nite_55150 [Actinoplanes ferrugineus]